MTAPPPTAALSSEVKRAARISRRSFLAYTATLPILPMLVALTAPPSGVSQLVQRGGWVLRVDDLRRLDIA